MNLYASFFALFVVSTSALQEGIVTEPAVEVEYDREYDFSRLDSYSWSQDQQPASEQADHIRIVKALAESLQKLGFTRDGKNPDVQVLYKLEAKQKKLHVDSRQRPSEWDPTDLETTLALGSHEEAYLVIEMYDSSTGGRIWRAKCVHPQPTPDKIERSLYQTVEHLFAAYPWKPDSQK